MGIRLYFKIAYNILKQFEYYHQLLKILYFLTDDVYMVDIVGALGLGNTNPYNYGFQKEITLTYSVLKTSNKILFNYFNC